MESSTKNVGRGEVAPPYKAERSAVNSIPAHLAAEQIIPRPVELAV